MSKIGRIIEKRARRRHRDKIKCAVYSDDMIRKSPTKLISNIKDWEIRDLRCLMMLHLMIMMNSLSSQGEWSSHTVPPPHHPS